MLKSPSRASQKAKTWRRSRLKKLSNCLKNPDSRVTSKRQPLGQANLKVVAAVGSLDLDSSDEAGSAISVGRIGP